MQASRRDILTAGAAGTAASLLPAARAINGDRYLALFNTGKEARDVGIDLAALGVSGAVTVRDLWERRAAGVARGRMVRRIASHGAGLYRLAAA